MFFKFKPLTPTLLFLVLTASGCTGGSSSVESEVIISESLDKVWSYNSNDENAKDWSIFFAKIEPCSFDDCPENKEFSSGSIGSIRRCFRNEDERGLFWDEKTLDSWISDSEAYRQIMTYNINGYGSKTIQEKFRLNVEQFYNEIEKDKTSLKFRVTYSQDQDSFSSDLNLSFFEKIYLKFIFQITKSRTKEIFEKNLSNIKYAIEQKENYLRPYPYEKFCNPEKFYCFKFLQDL